MLSIACILALAALIGSIVHGYNGRPPLWVAVLLLAIALLLNCLPIR